MRVILQWALTRVLGLTMSWPSVPPGEGTERTVAPVEMPGPPAQAELDAHAAAPATERGHVRWIGPLGGMGLAMAVAGVSGVAVGLVFIRRGVTVEPDHTDDGVSLVKDYTRPGWAIYGASFGATALGAIALAIDVKVGRERRFRRMTLRPQLGFAHAGLQLRGRF